MSTSSVMGWTTATSHARSGGDALLHQGAGVNEQSRADAFFEPMVAQIPHLAAQFDEPVGHVFGDAGFMLDDVRFDLRGGYVNSIAMNRCFVLCLSSLSTLW